MKNNTRSMSHHHMYWNYWQAMCMNVTSKTCCLSSQVFVYFVKVFFESSSRVLKLLTSHMRECDFNDLLFIITSVCVFCKSILWKFAVSEAICLIKYCCTCRPLASYLKAIEDFTLHYSSNSQMIIYQTNIIQFILLYCIFFFSSI